MSLATLQTSSNVVALLVSSINFFSSSLKGIIHDTSAIPILKYKLILSIKLNSFKFLPLTSKKSFLISYL